MIASIDVSEPFPAWAWPLAWAWLDNARHQALHDFSPKTAEEFVEYSSRAYARTFGIWKDGSLGGAVGIGRDSPCVATVHILLSRRLWGIPGAEIAKIGALLWESEPELQRIQAFVPAWNRLAIALCRRLGGTVEGTMRAATMRGGKAADAVVIGMTRGDYVNGIELRGVGRTDQQQLELVSEREPVEHVLGRAVERTGASVEPVLELDSFFADGADEPGHDSGDHGERGLDQQELRGNGHDAAKPARGARVRDVGSKRKHDAANGTGKRGRAVGKPVGGKRKPAAAKPEQPA